MKIYQFPKICLSPLLADSVRLFCSTRTVIKLAEHNRFEFVQSFKAKLRLVVI